MTRSIPHLRQAGDVQQLIVDDKPFLILGGELQNSQFSSARYMKDVWPRLKDANLNTIFGSVAWEQIEPVEDQFVFDELDQLILDAREHDLHLILLWFGSFKNALSSYTPSWVKRNPARFPRSELAKTGDVKSGGGAKIVINDALSVFGSKTRGADTKAFTAFMNHIKEVDEGHSTVVMVQVENECGLLGDSRDRSPLARDAWDKASPAPLVHRLKDDWAQLNSNIKANFPALESIDPDSVKSWNDVPGDKIFVEELFMAYYFAQYVEVVASAGASAYPLPLFTNVWQNYGDESRDKNVNNIVAGGDRPGDYPSGGGVANVLDVWKLFAPSLSAVCPDIYLNDYEASCASYRHRNQALIIPEQRRDEYGARRIWPAFGTHGAIGTAPFGIDTILLEENPFRRHYGLLAKVAPHVLEAQGKRTSFGFFFDELNEDGSDPSPTITRTFGKWELSIQRSFVFGKPSDGCGIIIHTSEDEFLLIGWGFQVGYRSTDDTACFNGLLRFEEKEITDKGDLRTLRMLNGDETRSGQFTIMPSEDPDYGGFPIAITIPAHTGIALCEPYALFSQQLDFRI